MGIIYVPEEKMLFKPLSVEENLYLGGFIIKDKQKSRKISGMFFTFSPG